MIKANSLRSALFTGAALTLLAGCADTFENFDLDMRDLGGNTLDTTNAARNLPPRPEPDNRGVISYPNYQVVVAIRGDTVTTVAQRLNINAAELARANALTVDTSLNQGAVLLLPNRVAEPSAATGAVVSGPIQPTEVDVTTLAAAAIDRAGPQATSTAPAATAAPQTATVMDGVEPLRHTVRPNETAYSIARLYNLPVRTLAEWNGLGSDLSVREGQSLLIPQSGVTLITEPESAPGEGTQTPVPPSAATPLPTETTTPAATATLAPVAAPDLGTPAPAANPNAPLIYPVRGNIVRAYSAGSNEGIDIAASAGDEVVAAAAGTVAAITRDTNGVAIVVIRHATDLLTVYTNLDGLTVAEGASVRQGQKIGVVKATNPAVVHFEVRLSGMKSANPEDYLP